MKIGITVDQILGPIPRWRATCQMPKEIGEDYWISGEGSTQSAALGALFCAVGRAYLRRNGVVTEGALVSGGPDALPFRTELAEKS